MNHLEIYDILLTQISKGVLKAGDKIKEKVLSEELGVSRTPLRQALFQLANSHFIVYESNKGFRVPPLQKEELRDCYPIIWSLEQLSLKLGFDVLKVKVKDLQILNEKFVKSKKAPKKAFKFDADFHSIICGASSNKILKKQIEDLKLRSARYDIAYFGDTSLIELSYTHHHEIIEGIETGDFEKASEALRLNWECGLHYFMNVL